ncbi:MAG TPA: hypothetical protein VG713_02460 [Pirellulales bacterium]|nr:hypothetical protein [Pirellulales bacterium]
MPRVFKRLRSVAVIAALGAPLGYPRAAFADETEAKPAALSTPVAEATVRQWIKELDADRFEVRDRAQSALTEAGYLPGNAPIVVAALIDAARHGSLEVTMRTMNVLQDLYESSAPPTREAAREALLELARSDNKALAAKAAAIVQPNGADAASPLGIPGMVPAPAIVHRGANFQINFGGMGGHVVQFQAMGNGERTAHVVENGRTIDLKEDANGIRVSVTEKVKGKDETRLFEAKDAEELKKRHPAVYQLYQQHLAGKGNGNMLIIGGGANVVIGPPGVAQLQQPQIGPQQNLAGELAASGRDLEAAAKRLRQHIDSGKVPESQRAAALEKLQAMQKQLGELEKQIGQ